MARTYTQVRNSYDRCKERLKGYLDMNLNIAADFLIKEECKWFLEIYSELEAMKEDPINYSNGNIR